MPRYSIIVPVYNVAPYLADCLGSVLAQEVNDWECICVDDGSTDDSALILDAYARRDSRFKMIHKSNGGVASARNVAMDTISGDWFLFLDSDDVWSPELLKVCDVALSLDNSVSLVKFKDKHFSQDGECEFVRVGEDIQFERIDMSQEYNYRDCGFLSMKIAFRRSLFGSIREKNYTVGEDLLFLAECSMRANSMLLTSTELYGYRDRFGSAVRRNGGSRMVLDSMSFYADIIRLSAHYAKSFSLKTKRWLGNALTERSVWEIEQLPKNDKAMMYNHWYMILEQIQSYKIFGIWQSSRLMLLNKLHWKFLQWTLCVVPSCLKRKGLHR